MKNILSFVLFLIFTFGFYLQHGFSNDDDVLNNLMQSKDTKFLKSYIKQADENSNSSDDLFNLAIAYHNLALIEENLKYSEKAVSLIDKASQIYNTKHKKDNPLYIIYQGSSYTLVGRDSKKIAQKVNNTNKGVALIDEGISLEPKNLLFRVIRAYNNSELPELFGRVQKVEEDLLFIEKNQKNNEYKKELQEIYYVLSKIEGSTISQEKRQNWFKKAYAFDENTDLAKKIKKDIK